MHRLRLSVTLLFTLAFFSASPDPLAAQDTTGVGSLSGVVIDPSHAPVPFATVCVADTARCAVSEETGVFHLNDLRPGEYRLEITAPGQPAITSDPIEVRPGVDRRVEVTLPKVEQLQQTVTVTGSAVVAPEEVKTSGFLIAPSEVIKGAGALQDVSRYVQALPGVVIGSNDFRNDIIVRGGSPLENLFVVDNVEVPNINTFANFASAGGSVSILDSAMIGDVTFLTGGYPASYINRASSVLQISQREGSRRDMQARATLGFAGAGVVAEGPFAKGQGSWIVSARRSFLDFFTKDIGFGGVPVAYTINAKAVYDVGPNDRIWLVNLSGIDNIRLGLSDNQTPDKEISNFDIRYSGSRSATGFNWQHVFGSAGVGLLGVTHSEARVGSTVKDLARNGIPAAGLSADQVIAQSPLIYSDQSREGESTLKYDATLHAGRFGKAQLGASVKVFGVSYDTAAPLGYDSPYSLARGVNAFSLNRTLTASQVGAYAQATTDLTPRLNVTWGGRLDHYQYISQTRVSPRVSARYAVTDRMAATVSVGQYYQQPAFLFLSVYPQNRQLLPFRADHYVAGLSYTASDSMKFTVEAYRKNYRDYPVATEYPSLSLANLGDTFNVEEVLFPLSSGGVGESVGLELYGEKKFTDKWFGQANLAFSKTRHAALDGVLRPGAFDYPVVFNLTGGYRVSPKWELSVRTAWLSGRPYTPFDLATSTTQHRGIYDLSRVNGERAPSYFRLDVRADRNFTAFGKPLLVFIGVQNITNRGNFAQYIWNRRTNTADFNKQLGVFPLIGMEWKF